VDSEELAALLEHDGFRLVAEPGDADAVMVNTCGSLRRPRKTRSIRCSLPVTSRRQAMRRPVVAVGCLAERYGRELAAAMPEADAILGFDDYADIVSDSG
jgi:tRNA A37 methylthiotransferase MiaB